VLIINNKDTFKVNYLRIIAVLLFFIICFIVITLKLLDLGFNRKSNTKIATSKKIENASQVFNLSLRKDIVDRNGVIIATNIKAYSLFAKPKSILDVNKATEKITKIFPDLKKKEVLEKLSNKETNFVWLKRKINPARIKDIDKIGDPGLGYKEEEVRIYPHGSLFSHILGFVDIDGIGLSGIERSYNNFLKDGSVNEENLRLSLDSRVQEVLYQELKSALEKYNAVGAIGIILDVEKNSVLASISLPNFNPNNFATTSTKNLFNGANMGLYEMGSTIKALTFANIIEDKKYDANELIDVSKPVKIGKFTINDHKKRTEPITPDEAFKYSSNIATIYLSQRLNLKSQYNFLNKFGLFDTIETEILERAKPIPPRVWDENKAISASFGYGFATTSINLIVALTAVINDGIYQKPTFVFSLENENEKKRLISSNTSKKMRELMRLTVESGTGEAAEINGLDIIGKTGTAEKVINGKYDRKRMISSFFSAFPKEKPKYAMFILLDEPKGIKETFFLATASITAVPVSKKIIQRIYPILGFVPKQIGEDDK
jgi:cell division protein FtsI (penicillin-binding protein 3)